MHLINAKISEMSAAFSSPRFAKLAGQSTEEIVAAIENLVRELHQKPDGMPPPDHVDRP